MLTRRNLRIKAFQALYAGKLRGAKKPDEVLGEFENNIEQFTQMYHFLLTLPHYFNEYLLSEKEIELEKYFPNLDKVRELSCFDTNPLVAIINNTTELDRLTKKSSYQWTEHGELFVKMYKTLKTTAFFTDYMVFEKPTWDQSKEFLIHFIGHLFENDEDFQEQIGGIYLDWDNDVPIFYRMLKKTLEELEENSEDITLYDVYVNRLEDYAFAQELITKTVAQENQYLTLMKEVTSNWDTDRIAKADIILMQMAITEFLYLPLIPVKVSINEYLDLAKSFSTNKSHVFVNGVLDRIKRNLLDTNKIVKEGRGLREN
jgi:N utilization substance protein B